MSQCAASEANTTISHNVERVSTLMGVHTPSLEEEWGCDKSPLLESLRENYTFFKESTIPHDVESVLTLTGHILHHSDGWTKSSLGLLTVCHCWCHCLNLERSQWWVWESPGCHKMNLSREQQRISIDWRIDERGGKFGRMTASVLLVKLQG